MNFSHSLWEVVSILISVIFPESIWDHCETFPIRRVFKHTSLIKGTVSSFLQEKSTALSTEMALKTLFDHYLTSWEKYWLLLIYNSLIVDNFLLLTPTLDFLLFKSCENFKFNLTLTGQKFESKSEHDIWSSLN